MTNAIDLTGQRFTRLLVDKRVANNSRGRAMWQCLCDCGKTTIVNATSLTGGNTRSCGCMKHEASIANGKAKKRHGMTKTPAWICWDSMLQRCNNPKHKSYPQYGGRGIKVCDHWHVFENFYADMGEPNGLTVDRIDVNGNYEKSNCRWATTKEQSRNMRSNRLLTLHGETRPMAYFTEKYGLSANLIADRIKRGWTVEQAILTPNSYIKRWLEVDGIKMPLMEIARERGIHHVTLQDRLSRGWSVEDALSTPSAKIANFITFKGETLSVSAWSKKLGVDRKWLRRSLNKMSVDEAFALAKTRSRASNPASSDNTPSQYHQQTQQAKS